MSLYICVGGMVDCRVVVERWCLVLPAGCPLVKSE